ncbi:hypothetical protein HK104_004457, partial [Borealophlyctis nickersoniae]
AILDSFKAAACSVTHLYKESLKQNRRAYQAGYSQCLTDVCQFLSQQPTQPGTGQMLVSVADLAGFLRTKQEQNQQAGVAAAAGATGGREAGKGDGNGMYGHSRQHGDVESNLQESLVAPSADQPMQPQAQQQQGPHQHHHQQRHHLQHPHQQDQQPSPQQQQQQHHHHHDQLSFPNQHSQIPSPTQHLFPSDLPPSLNGASPVFPIAGVGLGGNMDSLKRRWGDGRGTDLSFLGRVVNVEYPDPEPLFKRARWRRDDGMTD